VTANESRITHERQQRRLHTPDIGDQTLCVLESKRDLVCDRSHRCCHEGEINTSHETIGRYGVDRPNCECSLKAFGRTIAPNNAPTRFSESQTDRTTNETDPDDQGRLLGLI
jgi:hypothetical protein